MEAVDKNKTKGIIEMPTVVPDPPGAGGVNAAPETRKQRRKQNVGTVAERVLRTRLLVRNCEQKSLIRRTVCAGRVRYAE